MNSLCRCSLSDALSGSARPISSGMETYFTRVVKTAGDGDGQTKPVVIKKAGHFLQEDKGEELAENIRKFISSTGS